MRQLIVILELSHVIIISHPGAQALARFGPDQAGCWAVQTVGLLVCRRGDSYLSPDSTPSIFTAVI